MTGPERPVFIGFHLMKKENQDRKSGPNQFGSVRFCGFNQSLGPDFQALGIILIPCSKTITAEGTAQLLLENLYKRFGLLDKLLSDRGPQFA